MVVINQKKNQNFGENNSPEISLNSNLKRWFSRNIGHWKSNRTYFLNEEQKTYNICMNINKIPTLNACRILKFPDFRALYQTNIPNRNKMYPDILCMN